MVVAGRLGGVVDNGSVQGYRDDGVVLRTQKLGEADRIITVLTRHHGRIRAVARGIRRTKSRFGGRLEPFTHVDVMVHNGRSLDVITQAEVIRAYGTPLVSDYPKYTAGTAMLETAERFTPVEKEPAIRQFLLLIGGLRALGDAIEPGGPDGGHGPADGGHGPADGEDGPANGDAPGDAPGVPPGVPAGRDAPGGPGDPGGAAPRGKSADQGSGGEQAAQADAGQDEPAAVRRDPRMVLDAYFLRSLTFAGYAPALEECARCGSPGTMTNAAGHANGAKPLVAFAVAAGGMVCADCRPPGSASPASQTVALMVALLRGDWDEAMRSERRHRVECSGLVAAYLQWHLEHSIRSLRHVERA
jgi:recombinational DNA repair protein (RecF pathway)